LTDESLEAFRKKMSESGYSQEQRMEIAAGIARISLVLMVEDMETIPWDQELDPKIRRDFLKSLEVLHKFCEACGVKHRDISGRYEVPTSLKGAETSIKVSLGEEYNILYPNGSWLTDNSGGSVLNLPDLRAKAFLEDHAEQLYEAIEVETSSFILNTQLVCASVGARPALLRIANIEDMPRLSSIVASQLSAYREAKRLGVENYNLGMRFVKLMTSLALSSRAIPVTKRPDLDKLLIEAREVVSDLEQGYPQAKDSVEVQKLKCLLSLIPATPLSEESISVVARSPGHREEGAYLLVWQQALAGVEVNHDAAEIFLRSEFSSRDPIIKALVLHSLERNEEAFSHLEQLVEQDETWRDDLLRKANKHLKGLKEFDEDRYDALMPFLDE
jgi:hypothetical protein